MNCYPAYVYHVNENITRRNMAEYDRQRTAVERKAEEINPDYRNLGLIDQAYVRELAMKAINPDYTISRLAKLAYERKHSVGT